MKNTFFTADLHLGHANIIKHCNRPWKDVQVHDDMVIQNWNNVVNKGDTVFLLGDFCMMPRHDGVDRMVMYRKLRARLNGKVILVIGNHDSMSQDAYNSFTEVHNGIREINVNGDHITLCHYPMRSWNRSFHGSYHLFGHVHGRLERIDTGVSCDVGIDVPEWNYAPVLWETVKAKLDKKLAIHKQRVAYHQLDGIT